MAFDLSTAIAGDWSLFDSPDTVTIEDFDGVQTSVAGVTDSPLSKQRAAMLGPTLGVEDETRVFSLPVENLGSTVPQQGHKIIDSSGRVWAIVSCDLKTMDVRWSATCVRNRSELREDVSMTLTYATGSDYFTADNNDPRNFYITSTNGLTYSFLTRLLPDAAVPTAGSYVTASGTSGSISFHVHSVVVGGATDYTLNTWLAGSVPIPFASGESVTFTVPR